MKMRLLRPMSALLVLVIGLAAAMPASAADLRRGIPANAFVATYAKHNPERDYLKKYYDDIWKTVHETKILERTLSIITKRMSPEDVTAANKIIDELKAAAKPIDMVALGNAKEVAYAQIMQVPSAQHLMLMRVDAKTAESTYQGVLNLFNMAKKYAGGVITVETKKTDGITMSSLAVAQGQVPFSPTVAFSGDVLAFASSGELATKSFKMLAAGDAPSKFDDARVAHALKQLPKAEDEIVIFDGTQLFKDLKQVGNMVRQFGNNDPEVQKIAGLMDMVIDEMAVIDYEVTVGYTEGNLNKTAAYGKTAAGAEKKALHKAISSGRPFPKWHGWVPAGAMAYSLSTGVDMHPIYERVIAVVKEQFPEAKPMLAQFEQMQEQIGVHLDKDILQSFSGESVSVTLPKTIPTAMGGTDGVTAIRCKKPERIRELLHRLFAELEKNPGFKAQGIKLTKSPTLKGFEDLSIPVAMAFGVRPTIGFHDGWMIIGTSPEAVKKVLDAKSGKGKTVESTEAFKQFKLDVKGDVGAISYANTAAQTRAFAQFLNQAGNFAPMILGMAGAEVPAEVMEPVKEVLALLPSAAKIVAKFDFMEAKLSVTQDADESGAYRRHSVVVVRKPDSASK